MIILFASESLTSLPRLHRLIIREMSSMFEIRIFLNILLHKNFNFTAEIVKKFIEYKELF